MRAVVDLSKIGQGLAEPVFASQAIFRTCLNAAAYPGRVQEISSDAEPTRGVGLAACAMLLSLLDQDTSIWVVPSSTWVATDVMSYFRFHTGCTPATDHKDADFVLAASFVDAPALTSLRTGTAYFPEQGATLVLEVSAFESAAPRRLLGPGTTEESVLAVPDFDETFFARWQDLRRAFPCGIDLFLTCGKRLCALPRTTRIGEG